MRKYVKAVGGVAVTIGATQLRRLYRNAGPKQGEIRPSRAEPIELAPSAAKVRERSDASSSTRPESLATSTPDAKRSREFSRVRPPAGGPRSPTAAATPNGAARPWTPLRAPGGPARASGRGGRLAIAVAVIAVGSVGGLLAGSRTETDADGGPRAGRDIADYERTLDREVETLADARVAELKQLRDARTPTRQASASEGLAAAHRRTARSLQRAGAPPSLRMPTESLVNTLRRVADAYQGLAGAAAARDPSAYAARRSTLHRVEASLQRKLNAIRQL